MGLTEMMDQTNRSVDEPLVSVVTPVYNGEQYLAECIESVLNQSYNNIEYLIVNNRSTDRSLDIAKAYAKNDTRIRIIETDTFLSQVKNYNGALTNISPQSVYCKVVAADDRLLPRCLRAMVSVGEAHRTVGVVGAYTLLDWGATSNVYLTGLPYDQTMFSGKDICRRFLKDRLYVFGSPTATLIRSEIIRSRSPFYYEESVTEDVDLFFEILQSWDFGFVHEVLTYTRRYNESMMSALKGYGLFQLTEVVEITKYGKSYVQEKEYAKRRRTIMRDYYLMIGRSLLLRKPKEFWDFHRRGLKFAGLHLSDSKIALCALYATLDMLLNPKSTLERLLSQR